MATWRPTQARWQRTKCTYREVASVFAPAGLEFLVLKGFTHYPRFVDDPGHRPQGDLDLLLRPEEVSRAFDLALGLGYQPITEHSRPIDHLPMMIRKTGWQWRGDFFDAESPVSLELHFRLWDESTERFEPEGLDEFWNRRQPRELEDLRFIAFHPADELGYAALHALRHLLRDGVRPFHVYELAWHLHHSAEDASFWCTWAELHDPSLRRLEAICFSLAQHWFDCRVSGRGSRGDPPAAFRCFALDGPVLRVAIYDAISTQQGRAVAALGAAQFTLRALEHFAPQATAGAVAQHAGRRPRAGARTYLAQSTCAAIFESRPT